MTEFNFNGYHMHYTDSAAESPTYAPVIVFVHGFASSSKVYTGQIKYFLPTYRCIALDLFGHGKSDSPLPPSVDPDFYSLSSYGKSIIALLSHLSVEKATFIGWSLGSVISITIALTSPHVVDNLILVGTAPVFFVQEDDNDFPAVRLSKAPFLDNIKNQYETFYEPFVVQQYPEANGDLRPDYVVQAVSDAASMKSDVGYTIVNICSDADFRPFLQDIKARTLIVNGVDDAYIPVLAGKYMKEKMKECSFISYEECGHVPFAGPTAERFSTDVAAFLKHGKS